MFSLDGSLCLVYNDDGQSAPFLQPLPTCLRKGGEQLVAWRLQLGSLVEERGWKAGVRVLTAGRELPR